MGWLFSARWLERKDLIKHLTEDNGIKTLKHCLVGNNLWCLHEIESLREPGYTRFICLYKMQGPAACSKGYTGMDKDWWGYKDVCETMGPVELSCPASYLDLCTAPESNYAYEWRQRVYTRDRHLKACKAGVMIHYAERLYKIIKRRSPTSWLLETEHGVRLRAGIRVISQAEVVL